MAILNFGKRITSGFGLRLIRRNAMGQRSMLVIFAASVLFGSILPLGNAVGQSAKDVVGSYTLVSVANVQDGKKYEPYGPNPKGMMRLENNGRYVVVLIRPDLPKLASNDRNAGTLEEYKAIALGSFFSSWHLHRRRRPHHLPSREREFPQLERSGAETKADRHR